MPDTVNFAPLGGGCGIGWYSPALPLLQSEQTPLLDGPISGDMSGWIGASLAIGGIFGCLGFGLLGNWTGFKRSILLTAVPMIVSLAEDDDDDLMLRRRVIKTNDNCATLILSP